MLDLIRKKQKTYLIKFVFWGIIATFVGTIFLVWGKGSDEGGGGDPNTAASVNGSRIGFDEYQSAYSNLYRLYQEVYRDQFTPAMEKQLGLRQQALDALIDQALLLQEADRLDLEVDKKELVQSISAIPAFQENGTFSRDRYLQVLASQRRSSEGFEAMQRRQLLAQKARATIQKGVAIAEAEIEQEFRDRNDKIVLSFLRLSPAEFEKKVKADPEGLQAFFAKNQETFRLPEQVNLQSVRFEPDRYLQEIAFDEAEVEKWYRQHLDLFDIPEQVKASHILFRVAQDADPAVRQGKQKTAEKVLAEASSGTNFAQLARQHSEDPGTATRGGDLGFFPRGTMVAPFEQAAFALKPGETSGIVETPFGLHIIRVEQRIEARIKPPAEVAEEVKAGLREEKALERAYEKAMDAFNVHRKNGNLQAVAKEEGVEVRETGFFDREEGNANLGAPEVVSAAFSMKKEELARPVTIDGGVVLFGLKDRRESRLPELAEIRAKVEQAYRQQLSREEASRTAEKIVAELKRGRPLNALAQENGLGMEETGAFTRASGAFIPRLGSSDELAKAAAALTPQAPAADRVFEHDGKFVVAALKSRQDADPAALTTAMREEISKSLLAKRQAQAVDERLQELRGKAEITIAPSIASSLEGENS